MAEYNVRGNPVANAIYDKLLAPEEKPSYDGPIPEKPAGLNELPPNINMSAAPIKNLSELKTKTPQEQYEHDVQMKNPASAYTRKEKEDLKNIVEAAKDAGVLKDDGANTMNISFDDADLASQTPAGEASADGILPGSDGLVNQTDNPEGDGSTGGGGSGSAGSTDTSGGSGSGSDNNAGGDNPNGGGGANGNPKAKQEGKYKLRSIMDAYNEGLLDKESRDYLIVDALSKFARNTGKDLGNLAAAYTGGSQNNDRESGIWEERNKAMAEKGIGAEGNQFRANDNYDLGYKSQEAALESQQLANAKERIKMIPAKNFQEMANKLRDTNPTAAGFMDLIAAASTQSVDPEEYIAMAYANDPNARKLVDEVLKAGSNAASSIAEIMETVNGMGSDMKELSNALRKKLNL